MIDYVYLVHYIHIICLVSNTHIFLVLLSMMRCVDLVVQVESVAQVDAETHPALHLLGVEAW